MTRLEDRLNRMEKRIEEIHRLLVRLIELREGHPLESESSVGASGPRPESQPEEGLPAESLLEEGYDEWFEQDPLEIQYEIALCWAGAAQRDDLTEFQLAGRNLRNVDLRDAVLARANFSRADLTGAKLSKTILTGADFSKAQVARTDLSRAVLDEADLTFANLSYAKLEKANLRHALLTRANLSGANLSGADFGGAQLNKANLTRANLKNAAVNVKQLASASSLDGATMPDGRLYDGSPEPYTSES